MSQEFTGTVIRLKNPKTATIELSFTRIHPKYYKPQRIMKNKQVHYEVTQTEIVNWLTKYFQENMVKEIRAKGEELIIICNGSDETVLLKETVKKHEFWNIKDYFKKTKQTSLTTEKLKELDNSNFPKTEFPLQLGDRVTIKSDRPRSRTKRFSIIKKLQK